VCGEGLSLHRKGLLLTGSWRHSLPVQLWDAVGGRLLTNLPFHQPEHEACMVYCASFGRGKLDGLAFVAGSGKRPVLRVYQTVSV
jgi:hypothetical protein